MSLTPFNKIHQFHLSYNNVQKLSAIVLPKEPPNTYLRRKNMSCPISRLASSTRVSSDRPQDVSNEDKKVGEVFGSKIPIKFNEWSRNITKNTIERFDASLGLSKIRNAQMSLNVAQTSFLEVKERRERKQNLVDELNLKLRKPKPPKLILNEAVISLDELTNAVKEENDALSRLSFAINETNDLEALLEKRIEYWSSILLAIVTTLGLGIVGALLKQTSLTREHKKEVLDVEKTEDDKLKEINNKILELEKSILLLSKLQNEMIGQINRNSQTEGKMEESDSQNLITEKNGFKMNHSPKPRLLQSSCHDEDDVLSARKTMELLFDKLNEQQTKFFEDLTKLQTQNSNQIQNLSNIDYKLSVLNQHQHSLANGMKQLNEKKGIQYKLEK